MPDFEPLPRRPRAPVFEPRTGDYAVVVGRAKHRRRRHLSAAGAGVASVVAVVALSTAGGGGTFGLNPAPPAGVVSGQDDESPAPTASPEPEATSSAEPEEPGTNAGESAPPDEPPGPADADGEVPIDDGAPPSGVPRVKPQYVRDDIAMSATMVCDSDLVNPLVTATRWCLHYEGPRTTQVGVSVPYRLLACRHVGTGAETLTFDTEQQFDFTVNNSSSREEWRWSAGYPWPERKTEVRVGDGRCARWTIHWDATGADGDPMRPGDYMMWVEMSPASWGQSSTGGMTTVAGYDLTITE